MTSTSRITLKNNIICLVDADALIGLIYREDELHQRCVKISKFIEDSKVGTLSPYPIDHYVLALAKKNNIKYIFSFDDFYKKNGLTLLEDLI